MNDINALIARIAILEATYRHNRVRIREMTEELEKLRSLICSMEHIAASRGESYITIDPKNLN